MSYAPADLLDVRTEVMAVTGLSAASVGIVGDTAHDGGYHCGEDRTDPDDYSRDESPRDAHPTDAASALDIGNDWPNGGLAAAYAFNAKLVDACKRGDPRAEAVREVIYTTDGGTVKRFDDVGIRSGGDSSHLYHTHISFYRDSDGRRHLPTNALGLILECMGVAETMITDDPNAWTEARRVEALVKNLPATVGDATHKSEPNALAGKLDAIESAVLAGGVDPAVLAGALVAAFQDPAVKAALGAIVRAEVEAAEDS